MLFASQPLITLTNIQELFFASKASVLTDMPSEPLSAAFQLLFNV